MRKMKKHLERLSTCPLVMESVTQTAAECNTKAELHAAVMLLTEIRDSLDASYIAQKEVTPGIVRDVIERIREHAS